MVLSWLLLDCSSAFHRNHDALRLYSGHGCIILQGRALGEENLQISSRSIFITDTEGSFVRDVVDLPVGVLEPLAAWEIAQHKRWRAPAPAAQIHLSSTASLPGLAVRMQVVGAQRHYCVPEKQAVMHCGCPPFWWAASADLRALAHRLGLGMPHLQYVGVTHATLRLQSRRCPGSKHAMLQKLVR